MNFLKVVILLAALNLYAQIQDLRVSSLQSYLFSRSEIFTPTFIGETGLDTGIICWTLGEVEVLTNELITFNKKNLTNRSAKRLTKRITKFVNDRNSYCYGAITGIVVGGSYPTKSTKALQKSYSEYQIAFDSWISDFTPANWPDLLLKKSASNYLLETRDLLESIVSSTVGDGSIDLGWKPIACRKVGMASLKQDLANILLPERIKTSVAYSEIIKSRDSLRVEVCDSIRAKRKFNQEINSWQENLASIISQIENE